MLIAKGCQMKKITLSIFILTLSTSCFSLSEDYTNRAKELFFKRAMKKQTEEVKNCMKSLVQVEKISETDKEVKFKIIGSKSYMKSLMRGAIKTMKEEGCDEFKESIKKKYKGKLEVGKLGDITVKK